MSTDRQEYDELRKLVVQIHTQTLLISGEGLTAFNRYADEIKYNYMWSMQDAAARALALVDCTAGTPARPLRTEC